MSTWTPAQLFGLSAERWPGFFRVQLTPPQVDALLALDARDGGNDPGPTRSRGTWAALIGMGLVIAPKSDPSRPTEWAELEITEAGDAVLKLMRLAGFE